MTAYETTIDVRTADIGRSGHVNNAKFVDYLDLARDRFFEEAHGYSPTEIRHVVAHLDLDFERELRSLDPVTIGVDIEDVGTTSVTLSYGVRSDGHTVATARTVIVVVEETGNPTPVPARLRDRLTPAVRE